MAHDSSRYVILCKARHRVQEEHDSFILDSHNMASIIGFISRGMSIVCPRLDIQGQGNG